MKNNCIVEYHLDGYTLYRNLKFDSYDQAYNFIMNEYYSDFVKFNDGALKIIPSNKILYINVKIDNNEVDINCNK